ncbi:MAG: hypothetical protein ABI548_13995 [Polyangiaceae bacterium]
MSINGIGSTSTLSALTALNNTSNTDNTGAAEGAASTPASSTTVSKPGELMAKLSQLQQQDPAKFKQVTEQISDDLKTAASTASGPQAQFLSKLSDDFAQASSTGNLDSLKPPGGGEHSGGVHHHHGGGHHGGGGGGIEAVMSKALDEVNQALTGTPASSGAPAAAS